MPAGAERGLGSTRGSPARPGQIFTALRNACAAMLAPTCPHQVPIALHVPCGKQSGPWTKNHHVRKRLHRNARTHLSTPSSHCFPRAVWKTPDGPLWQSPTLVGGAKQCPTGGESTRAENKKSRQWRALSSTFC